MLLQSLLVLLPLSSHAVPALGIALPHFSEVKVNEEINKMSDTLKKGFHESVPVILRSTKSIAMSKPEPKNDETQDNSDHDDRGDGGRIVNIQGQKRNPVYPGAGKRKSIKLNKPSPTILIQDSYEPFHFADFPRFVTIFLSVFNAIIWLSSVTSSSINRSGVTLTSLLLTTSILNLKLTGEWRMECSLLKLCGTYSTHIPGSCLGWLKPFSIISFLSRI